jgi:O-antigen ligase
MKVAEASATMADSPPTGWSRVRAAYFRLFVVLTLVIALASFVRDRGQLLSNISFWLFLIPFAVSIWRIEVGFLTALFLLTVSASVHQQFNALADAKLHAWAYPGVDCCLGFLAAWTLKVGLGGAREVLNRFPSGPLLLLHAWMTLSAVMTVGRNIWQSASELSLRGLAYNVWLARGISWHDDYYPLQDPFFYSVALAMLFATWAVLDQGGKRLLSHLVGVVLAGAASNVLFALWQKATGMGWVNGQWAINANALWPDLHSFGVFMAMALLLGYGFLVNGTATPRVKTAAGMATLLAAVGLYLSGSRSTLFFLIVLLFGWAIWAMLKLRGWRRALPLFAALAVAAAVHWTLEHGYRDISYALLSERLKVLDQKSLNVALSHRPEIWAAALRMYLAFPFFGLGQGAFYRLSIVPEFSSSQLLIGVGGDGVHNEFLRILVELGPVGLGLVLFMVIPFVRLGRQNLHWTSFYALAGIALGSIYTNAILVRELLMLCGVFAGGYFWEVQAAACPRWRPPARTSTRYATVALATLTLAALIEVAFSFGRFPFTYGQRCREVHPLAKDGWTQGVLRVPVPPAAALAELTVLADRPDLERRSLDLELSVLSEGGASLAAVRHTFKQRETDPRSFQLSMPESAGGKRLLELKPSHCYVPLNLGITYDPRRLGVRVTELRFRTAAGAKAH